MKDLHAISQGYDISVFGSPNSGKSSLIQRYIHSRFIENLDPTVQDLYTKYRGPDLDPVTILDTVNVLEGYSVSGRSQVRHSRGFMYVYSIVNRDTFDYLEELHYKLQLLWGPEAPMPPIVLVGAMCDLEMERQVSTLEGKEMAQRIGAIHFHEASSLWGTGVSEVFEPLISLSSKSNDSHKSDEQEILTKQRPHEVVSLQQMLLSPVVSLNDLSETKIETASDVPVVKDTHRRKDSDISTTATVVAAGSHTNRLQPLEVRKQQSRLVSENAKKSHSCCVIM